MTDPLNDPRFPERPTHPDFWRMSQVALKHDGRSKEDDGLVRTINEYVDMDSLLYAAEHRLGNAGLGLAMSQPQVKATLLAMYLDAFCLGVGFEKEGGHRDG